MEIQQIVHHFCEGLKAVDSRRLVEKTYKPGIGPFPEARTVDLVFKHLAKTKSFFAEAKPSCYPGQKTKCDIVIPGQWAIEFKLARPFGDNGRPAEHWIENVLYPYEGNQSALGDCMKLLRSNYPFRKAVVIFGFEHTPPLTDLTVAIDAFELVAKQIIGAPL